MTALYVNYIVNRKFESLQKIKAISFMKLTKETAKQHTSVNLNSL